MLKILLLSLIGSTVLSSTAAADTVLIDGSYIAPKDSFRGLIEFKNHEVHFYYVFAGARDIYVERHIVCGGGLDNVVIDATAKKISEAINAGKDPHSDYPGVYVVEILERAEGMTGCKHLR